MQIPILALHYLLSSGDKCPAAVNKSFKNLKIDNKFHIEKVPFFRNMSAHGKKAKAARKFVSFSTSILPL